MNNNSRAPLPPPYPELQKLWCSSPVHPHQASPIIGHVSANCSWSFRQDGSVHTSVEATKDTNVSRFFARHFTELQAAALFDQNNFEKHRDPGQVGDFEAWKYSRNYWRRQEDIKNLSLGPRAFLLSQQSGGSPDQVVLNQNAATVQPDGGVVYIGPRPETRDKQQAATIYRGEAVRPNTVQATREDAERTAAGTFQDRSGGRGHGRHLGGAGDPYGRDHARAVGLSRRRNSIHTWEQQRNLDLARLKEREEAAKRKETEEDHLAFPRLPPSIPAVKMPGGSPLINLLENVGSPSPPAARVYRSPRPDGSGDNDDRPKYGAARTSGYDSDRELMSDESSSEGRPSNGEQDGETLKVD